MTKMLLHPDSELMRVFGLNPSHGYGWGAVSDYDMDVIVREYLMRRVEVHGITWRGRGGAIMPAAWMSLRVYPYENLTASP